MSLPTYLLQVRAPSTGELLYQFQPDITIELRASRVLNDVGSLALLIPDQGEDWEARFPWDGLVDVYREYAGGLTLFATYLVRSREFFIDGNRERIAIGGLSLNDLLRRRVIDPDDDPAAAGGYSTKAGTAGDVMRAYAREQIADLASAPRQIPNLTVPSTSTSGDTVGDRVNVETSLLALMQKLAEKGGIDFEIVRTTAANLELRIGQIGSDLSKATNYPTAPYLPFAQDLGNLIGPSQATDRKAEQNFLYARTSGDQENAVVFKVSGDGVSDSPYNRAEFAQSLRETDGGDLDEIFTAINDAFKKMRAKVEFAFDASASLGGGTYLRDWDLGTIVTALWRGSEYTVRIDEITLTLSENNEGIDVKVTNENV